MMGSPRNRGATTRRGRLLPLLLLLLPLAASTSGAARGLGNSAAREEGGGGPPAPAVPLAAAVADVLAYARKHMHDIPAAPPPPCLLPPCKPGSPTGSLAGNLSATLNRTLTFTATETWHHFHAADGTVFVDTGDIHQQWLRDSCNQMRAYLPLAAQSPAVGAVFVGALKRMSRFFLGDACEPAATCLHCCVLPLP